MRSVDSGAAISFCVFNVSDYHQAELFVRIEKIKYPIYCYITLAGHRWFLCANHSAYVLSSISTVRYLRPFTLTLRSKEVTTHLSNNMTAGYQLLNKAWRSCRYSDAMDKRRCDGFSRRGHLGEFSNNSSIVPIFEKARPQSSMQKRLRWTIFPKL